MTDEELAAIRRRADAASPGPWKCRTRETGIEYANIFIFAIGDDGCAFAQVHGDDDTSDLQASRMYENGAFIAAARTDVPALLDEVERLRAMLRCVVTDEDGFY